MDKVVSQPGILRYYFGHWIATRKRAWTFPELAVSFMVLTLRRLLALLESDRKPSAEIIISLRMDCCACENIIDCRCHGLPELYQAQAIIHFQSAEWLPHITLEEILEEPSQGKIKTRKSA